MPGRVKILERDLSRRATDFLRGQGCVCIKLSTLQRYGTPGWPDYLVLQPGGVVWFLELKTGRNKLTALQEERRKTLEALGFFVFVARTREEVESTWRILRGTRRRR